MKRSTTARGRPLWWGASLDKWYDEYYFGNGLNDEEKKEVLFTTQIYPSFKMTGQVIMDGAFIVQE